MAVLGSWGISTDPWQIFKSGLKSGSVTPVSGVVGTATKVGIGVVGGAAAAVLLGGGVDQTQSQKQDQETTAKQKLETQQEMFNRLSSTLTAAIKSTQEQAATQTVSAGTTVGGGSITSGGGSVTYAPYTSTVTTTGLTTEAFSGVINALAQAPVQETTPQQIIIQMPSQEQAAEQTATVDQSLLTMLIVGAVAIAGIFLFRRKK